MSHFQGNRSLIPSYFLWFFRLVVYRVVDENSTLIMWFFGGKVVADVDRNCSNFERLERAIDDMHHMHRHFGLRPSVGRRMLTNINPKDDHTIYPVGLFKPGKGGRPGIRDYDCILSVRLAASLKAGGSYIRCCIRLGRAQKHVLLLSPNPSRFRKETLSF